MLSRLAPSRADAARASDGAAALLIYTAATADVKNCGSTGAATKEKPAVATAAGQVEEPAAAQLASCQAAARVESLVEASASAATCGGIVSKPGASTEAAEELQALATELMKLITAAEEKSKEKKN